MPGIKISSVVIVMIALFATFAGTAANAQESLEEITTAPYITIEASMSGGDFTLNDVRFYRDSCESKSPSISYFAEGNAVTIPACYQTNLPLGTFQGTQKITPYLFVDGGPVAPVDHGYTIAVSGVNCDATGTYTVTEGLFGTPAGDATCIFTLTHEETEEKIAEEEEEVVEEEAIEEEEVVENEIAEEEVTEEEEVEEIPEVVEEDVALNYVFPSEVGSDFVVTGTIDGESGIVEVAQGDVVDVNVTVENISGAEDVVVYIFMTQIKDPSDITDDGVFVTDKFYVDQKVPVGSSEEYTFPWRNDEEAGTYRFYTEVKAVDWSENLHKKQLSFITVADSITPLSLGGTLHRFWSEVFRGHFYTESESEAENLRTNDANWTYEGSGDKVVNLESLTDEERATLGIFPVYRFWSENYKHHFYTMSEEEKAHLIATDENWKYEAIAYYAYADREMDTTPVYRFYSATYQGHFYTSSGDERVFIEENDTNWSYEGIAWYIQR